MRGRITKTDELYFSQQKAIKTYSSMYAKWVHKEYSDMKFIDRIHMIRDYTSKLIKLSMDELLHLTPYNYRKFMTKHSD